MRNGGLLAWWVRGGVHDARVPKLDLSQHRGGETCPCLVDPNLLFFENQVLCRYNAERIADISPQK